MKERLRQWTERAQCASGSPTLQAALIIRGQLITHTVGRVSSQADSEASDVTRFALGSTAKLMTGLVLQRLQDKGKIHLSDPLLSYLPDLRGSHPEWLSQISLRTLLTHTSGIDGDLFTDTGDGLGAIALYCHQQFDQLFEPGTAHSYCNAGFALLSRVAEIVTGSSWLDILEQELRRPLNLETMILDPRTDSSASSASGFFEGAELPCYAGPSALTAAGATIRGCASDLVKIGHVIANKGQSLEGLSYLPAHSIDEMQRDRVAGPSETFADAWGLGLMMFRWAGDKLLLGHDGATPGHWCSLRAFAETGISAALIVNGGDVAAASRSFHSSVFEDLAGICPRPLPGVSNPENDEALLIYAGRYESRTQVFEVTSGSAGLCLTIHGKSDEGGTPSSRVELQLHYAGGDRFIVYFPGSSLPAIQTFILTEDRKTSAALVFRGRYLARAGGLT